MTNSQIQRIINQEGGNFRHDEFLSGRENLKVAIIRQVVRWRNWHGFSMQITSAHRDSGSHSTGLSIDGLLWRTWKHDQPSPLHLWRLVTTWPFMGAGIYFDWDDGIGLHMDLITPPVRDRPLRWLRREGDYYYQDLMRGSFYNRDKNEYLFLEDLGN